MYIYCDVAVPTRVHPPRKSWRGASRADAPEKDCESRIDISGETSYYYNFASLLILFFCYYFVRRATRRRTIGRGQEKNTSSDYRYDICDLSFESGDSARGSRQHRVAGGNSLREKRMNGGRPNSCHGPESEGPVGAIVQGWRTNHRPRRRPPISGSWKSGCFELAWP